MPKIIVKSTTDRFRRAGIEFNRHGVEIDTAELTKAQLDAIKNEPRLAFAPAKPDADSDGDGGEGGGDGGEGADTAENTEKGGKKKGAKK